MPSVREGEIKLRTYNAGNKLLMTGVLHRLYSLGVPYLTPTIKFSVERTQYPFLRRPFPQIRAAGIADHLP